MKLDKFAYFIFKTTWKSYFEHNEKVPGNLLKINLKKSWKFMEFCQSEKVGALELLDAF